MLENNILLTFVSAILCVLARVLLNVMDRIMFFNHKADFLSNMALNTIMPFFLCCLLGLLIHVNYEDFWSIFFNLNVFLAAMIAQLVSYVISYALKHMPVQNVSLTIKASDIFLPVGGLLLSNNFNLLDYSFSFFTTLAFIPILISSYKNRLPFVWFISLMVLSSIILQATINIIYPIQQFSKNFYDFMKLMTVILFWRTLISSALFLYEKITFIKFKYLAKKDNYYFILSRPILALIAQVAFFFSISKNFYYVAWPILNSAPIVACFVSSIFLSEKSGREIFFTLILLILISCSYLLIKLSL